MPPNLLPQSAKTMSAFSLFLLGKIKIKVQIYTLETPR